MNRLVGGVELQGLLQTFVFPEDVGPLGVAAAAAPSASRRESLKSFFTRIQKTRSLSSMRARFTLRFKTASWWRRTTFSMAQTSSVGRDRLEHGCELGEQFEHAEIVIDRPR